MRLGRHATSLMFAACVIGLTAGALFADTTTPTSEKPASTASASLQSMDGKVVSTSASALVILTDAGTRQTFNLDAATAEPASLAAGDRVTVRYSTLTGGGNHADAVTLAAAPSTAPAPSTLTTTQTTTTTSASSAPAAEPLPADATAPSTALPRTASSLPLILLVGTLAALIAFGVHLSRRERGV